MTRLAKERKAAKLSQAQLAHFASTTQGTVSKIENRKLLAPSFDVLARLAWALRKCGRKVDPADLNPIRQPVLVTGAFAQKRRRSA